MATLTRDLARAVAQAGVNPSLDSRDLQLALRRAIATRRGYCDWTVDHASWVVLLLSPEEHQFYGKTLEEALAWCLVWLMQPELGIGPFTVSATESSTPSWEAIPQPFAIGDRVIVIANEHAERDTVNLIGRTGTVREVYPYPIDRLMECGVLLDPLPERGPHPHHAPPDLVVGGIEVVFQERSPEERPRLFPPSTLARFDPEFDPVVWNGRDDELAP